MLYKESMPKRFATCLPRVLAFSLVLSLSNKEKHIHMTAHIGMTYRPSLEAYDRNARL